ncbi:Pyridoxine/pyridoxamine 5'-phosphate oxidase [Zhongshania aliphaticivorans]|uniref:Pyridoxine/pyridoxamine 5'-phosphate oxidase n=1 Tax=Zhongshania aliphaticivorans TaxID=1470434 RepID=A0A5S9PJE0_9GAMM|nr:pyridoxamine 5'-phosphate oxidase family protein [Zhongshania aliphaticivorans]CAA0104062.1 Pyridoxine/pyridoxamine 5'-phosphate oxidase [Zhongshania aliphaticivorans]CAA0104242.1 Pyridoxine/pyridoxamine 5'-phosphate oxidase [Zhongshania aliphaticivorans]
MTNPIALFQKNWQQAKSLDDANAPYCTLATVSAVGQVSVRTLVLREVTATSFLIFINDSSPKWQDIQHSNNVELHVFWPSLLQQYRIRGECHSVPVELIQQHWARKPYDAKILDHYYQDVQPQSSGLDSREALLKGINEIKRRYPNDADIPYPANARGVEITANYIEVWHSSTSERLHHRSLYQLKEANWDQQILVP